MRVTPVMPCFVALPAALLVALTGPAVVAPAASSAPRAGSAPSSPVGAVSPHPVEPQVTSLPIRSGAAAASSMSRQILTAPAVTGEFDTIGVTWLPIATSPDLVISARTKTNGIWTSWTPLDTDDDDGSEDPVQATGLTPTQAAQKGLRAGTSSLWVGLSTGVQVRVAIRSGAMPADMQAELINPGTSAADATATPEATGSRPGISAASMSEPAIYSRRAWGADESKVRHAPAFMSTIKAAVIHHTAGPNHYSRSQVPGIIRGDYAYHLKRGWSDIGYNALVDRFGRIWEGRAGGADKAVMGAHAGGFNSYTFGISMIGNYETARPSSAAVEAVARAIAWKLDLNHRYPLGATQLTSQGGGTARYRAGTTVTLPIVMGHRNTGFTACPGRYLYRYLPHIRQRVRTLMKAALTNPSTSPDTTTLGTPVWIGARSLAAQTWGLRVTALCSGATVATSSGRVRAGESFTATWNGKLAGGTLALPGAYRLELTSRSRTGVARPVTNTVLVQPPPVPDAPAAASSTGSGGYTPVTPARLAGSAGNSTLIVAPRSRVDVPVLGRNGVPASGVTSVVLNVTASCASDGTSLEVWPTGGTRTRRPVTALAAGGARSVLITSQVGANGSVSIAGSAGVTRLAADVVGYYSPSGSKVLAVPATRILDTSTNGGALAAGASRSVSLPPSIGGIASADITAVAADLSALNPSGNGTLSAYRTGAAADPPSLVFAAGTPTDSMAMIPVTNGAFVIKTAGGATGVTVDVRGIVTSNGTGYGLTAITPKQVLSAIVAAGAPRSVAVTGGSTGVPAGVTGVLVGLTAATPSATGSFEVFPSTQSPGPDTAMRVKRGQTRGTVMLVPVGTDGKVTVKLGAGRSAVQLDVRGYLS